MSFDPHGLTVLTSGNGFTLWHYRTNDDRATVLTPGYFTAAAGQLLPGDLVIVQAADATAMVPIRAGGTTGIGITVDPTGTAPLFLRSASLPFGFSIAATASARAIVLDALPADLMPGESFEVGATVFGPITRVTFRLIDGGGADAAPPQTVLVSGGRASATFTAPNAGGGYRIRAADTDDPTLATLSPPLTVNAPPRLLLESGGRLLAETGAFLGL